MKGKQERREWENSGKWQWVFRKKKMGKKKYGWGSRLTVWRKWR